MSGKVLEAKQGTDGVWRVAPPSPPPPRRDSPTFQFTREDHEKQDRLDALTFSLYNTWAQRITPNPVTITGIFS